MSNNFTQPEQRGRQPEGALTVEHRRWPAVAMADYRVENAIAATYPHIMLPVQLEVDGETPENAASAARASTMAAHQAIQSAIAQQVPEAN